jgi:hypothetical protein
MLKSSLHVKPFWWLTLLLTIAFPDCQGQTGEGQFVHWLRYQAQISLSEKIYWNNDIDNRRFIDPDVQSQLIIHSRLHYRKSSWDYGGGLTLSWAFSPDKNAEVKHATMELRPVLEVTHESRLRSMSVNNRLRLDNRFFEKDKFDGITGSYSYVARFRYRIQARIQVATNKAGAVVVKLADEIMVNHKENFFDQNRVYATTEIPLTKQLTVEAGYIYIYQQRFATDSFVQRHVLRFSILHKFSF